MTDQRPLQHDHYIAYFSYLPFEYIIEKEFEVSVYQNPPPFYDQSIKYDSLINSMKYQTGTMTALVIFCYSLYRLFEFSNPMSADPNASSKYTFHFSFQLNDDYKNSKHSTTMYLGNVIGII